MAKRKTMKRILITVAVIIAVALLLSAIILWPLFIRIAGFLTIVIGVTWIISLVMRDVKDEKKIW